MEHLCTIIIHLGGNKTQFNIHSCHRRHFDMICVQFINGLHEQYASVVSYKAVSDLFLTFSDLYDTAINPFNRIAIVS